MRRRGFSLVEVLVSVAILSFMGILIFESFSQASAAKEENEGALDRYQAVRVALSRMVRDLSMAFLSKHKDPQMGTDKFRTIFRGDRDKLVFTTLSHVRLFRDAKESDQCEVSYWLKRGQGGTAIWRRESRRIDDKPEQGGPSMMLLDDIERLELKFWDDKVAMPGQVAAAAAGIQGAAGCQDDCWKDRWDTTQLDGHPDRLPPRVQINLHVKDEFGKTVKYQTEARLMMREPFNF